MFGIISNYTVVGKIIKILEEKPHDKFKKVEILAEVRHIGDDLNERVYLNKLAAMGGKYNVVKSMKVGDTCEFTCIVSGKNVDRNGDERFFQDVKIVNVKKLF